MGSSENFVARRVALTLTYNNFNSTVIGPIYIQPSPTLFNCLLSCLQDSEIGIAHTCMDGASEHKSQDTATLITVE
eukprot:5300933-Pleurochrysis_carterae.AAC.1